MLHGHREAVGSHDARRSRISLSRYGGREQWWPLGTRGRLTLAVPLRRGDATRLGRRHIKNGRISIATGKAGTQVTIPLAPKLVEAIKAVKIKGLSFAAQKNAQPLTNEPRNGSWHVRH